MDHPLRLVRLLLWFCVGLLFGGVSVLAYAETIPATPEYEYTNSIGYWYLQYAPAGQWPTPEAACAAVAAYGYPEAHAVYYSPTQYPCKNTANTVTYNTAYFNPGSCPTGWTADTTLQKCKRATGYSCPAGQNWTLDGSNCTRPDCVAGQTRDPATGICQVICVAGSQAGYYATGFATSACIGGCSLTRSAAGSTTMCSGWSDSSGWSSCYLAQSGQNCSTPSGTFSTSAPQCPVGQCPGTVNGTSVCVACTGQTDTQSTSTKTTTAPDGTQTSTTTTTSTTTNTTTNTTTTSTSTSTTTTPPGGSPTTTTSSEQSTKPTDAFCVENPGSPLCKPSTFAGGCGAFSCDGDAVQCAMAKEQHKRNCTMFDTATPLSTLGEQVAAGSDPLASNYPTAPGQVQTINLASSIDTTNPFAGGCLQDKSFTIMTSTIVIPFSNICPYLEAMGNIVLAFALLAAARIAFSGV